MGADQTLYRDPWARFARPLRRLADLLFFLGPEFVGPEEQIARAEKRTGPGLRRLVRLPRPTRPARAWPPDPGGRGDRRVRPRQRRAGARALRSRARRARARPHLMPGGRHSEYVRAARSAGIPTCMCIASWDNLSSKQQLRVAPDRLVVWNGLPAGRGRAPARDRPDERIVITGAPSFDQWFERKPRPREEFLHASAWRPTGPISSSSRGALFPGSMTEAEYLRRRLDPGATRRTRGCRDVQLLSGPIRGGSSSGARCPLDHLSGVAVWPRG